MQRLLDACFWPLSRFAAAHQFANELRHSGRADRALTSRMTWTDPIDLCQYTQDTDRPLWNIREP